MIRYGTVAQMVAYLDREEIAAARERRFERFLYRLKTAKQRRFVRVFVHTMLYTPCKKVGERKKVMQALKIKGRTYFSHLQKLHKPWTIDTYVEGRVENFPH